MRIVYHQPLPSRPTTKLTPDRPITFFRPDFTFPLDSIHVLTTHTLPTTPLHFS